MGQKNDDKDKKGAEEKPDPSSSDDKGSTGQPPANGDQTIPKQRFDEVIAERNKLREEKEAREKAEREATEKKAIEDGKLQEVINAKTAEIATLTATAARVDTLVKAFEAQIEAESKDWPEEAKAYLAVGETIEKKLELLPHARSLAVKLTNGGAAPPPGTGDKPKPKGDAADAEADKRAKAADAARLRR